MSEIKWSWVVFGCLWLASGGFLSYKVVSGHGSEVVSYSKLGNPQTYVTYFVVWFVFSIVFAAILRRQRPKKG